MREYEEEREKHITDLLDNFQKGMNAGYEKAISELKDGKVECSPVMKEFIDKLFAIGNAFNFGFGPKDIKQEQPEQTCKTCGFYENNCPFIRDTFAPYPNKVCKDYTYSVMKEQEQPEVDLEKEIIRYQREDMDRDTTVRDVAHHFFERGLNARKEVDK